MHTKTCLIRNDHVSFRLSFMECGAISVKMARVLLCLLTLVATAAPIFAKERYVGPDGVGDDGDARQPEAGGRIGTNMIIAAALIEGFTFFALVIAFQLAGKIATI